jgi:hypothetical protein
MILALAFVLRLIWMQLVPVLPISDSNMYHEFAKSISSGQGYSYPNGALTAYWPVGTSAIYGALYHLFGVDFKVIATFNIFVGLATTWLIIGVALAWFKNSRIALIAGFLYAIWPSQIQFTTILASELLFNLFSLAGLYFWTKNISFHIIVATACFVAAAFIRPIALLLPFILLSINFLQHWKPQQTIIRTMTVMLVMAVLISPWAYRNYLIFDTPVLISTNGGPVLWMGNNPESIGEYMPLPTYLNFESEVDRAKYFKQKAVEHIVNEPTLFLKRMGKRFIDYYRSENIGVVWNNEGIKHAGLESYVLPLKLISSGFWVSVVLLSAYALTLLVKQMGAFTTLLSSPIPILLLYYTSLHMVIASGDRYHFPIIPLLAVLAAYSLQSIGLRLNNRLINQ